VFIIGWGAALFLLLFFAAGVPAVAFGVGGGIAIIGAASFINGVLSAEDASDAGNA
jgi:hypothetical protein